VDMAANKYSQIWRADGLPYADLATSS